MAISIASRPQTIKQRLSAFFAVCKPKVNALIVFTAMIGMYLPTTGTPALGRVLIASLGIALVAGAAAAINCLVERTIDARMARTRYRPSARGEISSSDTLGLAMLVGGSGLWLLHTFVNDLTMWLTLATFVGYAVIYTVLLKPSTPMNIVIGGASGAMPPVLGWAAVTGSVGVEAFVLFLIIFMWTPPHFWALACYRREEYAQAGLPMLPVTHGVAATCRQMAFYTVMLSLASALPVYIGMSGWVYLALVALLDLGFITLVVGMCRRYSDALAKKTFAYSIIYLTALFVALFIDRIL